MKKKLSILLVLAMTVVNALLLAGKLEFSVNDASADPVSAQMTISVNCVAPATAVFIPSLVYKISVFNNKAMADVFLSNEVNGDSLDETIYSSRQDEGRVVFHHNMPAMKVGGLQCKNIDSASLSVRGEGSADSKVKVSIERAGVQRFNGANRVDDLASDDGRVLFGSGGQIYDKVRDGHDGDHMRNGEIVFGGKGNADVRSGGSEIFLSADTSVFGDGQSVEKHLAFNISVE